ncbi:MAG: lysine--tRNA ligase [Actinomycetota bacterium]|nr:lysine--tRNA ligase [Actinomycetota bacterium]
MSDEPGREAPPDLLAARRQKLERLRAEGIDPFPHAFPGVTPIAAVRQRYGRLAAGEETEETVRVAGRLAARRAKGKAAFLDLVDRDGRIQLLARVDDLGAEAYERLLSLDLGDLIGADGRVISSRAGELTVALTGYTILAKSLRPPPEKHHGLRDVETRYRRRELDLMASEEARGLFRQRAQSIAAIRRFLDDEGFMEVETPVLQPLYGGALARPFVTHHNALDRRLYLRIATELYLKRCIVGGLERVYELGRDFRNEGLSPKHNPEFTMLESYEAYADYLAVADRFERLVHHVAQAVGYAGPHSLAPPWRRETVQDAILQRTGVDILAHRDRDALAAEMRAHGLEVPDEHGWAQLVDVELISKHVEPHLAEPTLLLDYPVELSPFAKAHRSEPGLVERFEAFAGGIELANAFTELNDPDEQRARFEAQRAAAAAGDEEAQPFDEGFLRALEHGMPPTGGIGIGIDRLTMLLSGRRTIREVVLFPQLRDP